ncbi:MAG: hypothetical protein AAF127_01990 [Pseudomonadota bacterium]
MSEAGKSSAKAEHGEQTSDQFLTKEDLVRHLAGTMMPKGKKFAPSLVMWGDPHGAQHDIDRLDHLSPPDDPNDDGEGAD